MRPKSKKLAPDKYRLPGGPVEYGKDLKTTLRRQIDRQQQAYIAVGQGPETSYPQQAANDLTIHANGLAMTRRLVGTDAGLESPKP